MSVDTKHIPNEKAIPRLSFDETTVFNDNPESRFALGILARGKEVSKTHRELFSAYLRLRANVYIDQTDMLDDSHRRVDGTEMDDDDERSVHIVAIENRVSHVAVVASMRLIEKTKLHDSILPVEDFFGIEDIPVGGNEISRYINRLDDRLGAAQVRNALFMTGLSYIHKAELSPTMAVVEPKLEARLQQIGVPVRRIGEPKFVEEYNETNLGLEIDTDAFVDQFGGPAVINTIDTTPEKFTYWGEVK
ncbi:MAG: acyl-homoserine-lactone synthase [Candidatus Saccharimonadales bacterium]